MGKKIDLQKIYKIKSTIFGGGLNGNEGWEKEVSKIIVRILTLCK